MLPGKRRDDRRVYSAVVRFGSFPTGIHTRRYLSQTGTLRAYYDSERPDDKTEADNQDRRCVAECCEGSARGVREPPEHGEPGGPAPSRGPQGWSGNERCNQPDRRQKGGVA